MKHNLFILPVGTFSIFQTLEENQPEAFTELGQQVNTLLAQQENAMTTTTLLGMRPESPEAKLSSEYFNAGYGVDLNYQIDKRLNPLVAGYLKLPSFQQKDLYALMSFFSGLYRQNSNVVVFAHEPLFKKVLPHFFQERFQLQTLVPLPKIGEMIYLAGDLKKRQGIQFQLFSSHLRKNVGKILYLPNSLSAKSPLNEWSTFTGTPPDK